MISPMMQIVLFDYKREERENFPLFFIKNILL